MLAEGDPEMSHAAVVACQRRPANPGAVRQRVAIMGTRVHDPATSDSSGSPFSQPNPSAVRRSCQAGPIRDRLRRNRHCNACLDPPADPGTADRCRCALPEDRRHRSGDDIPGAWVDDRGGGSGADAVASRIRLDDLP
ncbi:hypothetical protein [Paracoccus spongiarum]|uniref:Uncharacterized protein n=1 Tax=Paracoccus spongiarum TaxID=3064387 RepID=A0ABT9JC54_9RHOB|nr:hypothetical protein [Paracoccus sp. 2205BS29-5]MDP5307392.1 hypothetical protein [Paracoccus sp. 2205BS29-5]